MSLIEAVIILWQMHMGVNILKLASIGGVCTTCQRHATLACSAA